MEQPNPLESNLENEDRLLVKDKLHLLQILPAEIWQHVITRLPKRHLQSCKENLSNSSPFYRDIFTSQTTAYLLGKVINILVNNNHLELPDALKCRQICKFWNAEIDNLLTTKNCKLRSMIRKNKFDSYHKLVTFLAHFQNTHLQNGRSPFVGDKVILELNDEYDFIAPNVLQVNQLKLDLITTIIEKYGIHIKYLSIKFQFVDNQVLKRSLAKTREWLIKIENLEKLKAINRTTYFHRASLENGHPFLSQSFPKLDKLEEIHLSKCIPDDVGLNLLRSNDHVRILTIKRNWRSNINHDYKISNFPALPNLNYLDINTSSIGKVENLMNVDFTRLSTLTLTAKREYNFFEQTRWAEIFTVIETKFGNTLERLSVEMGDHDSQVLNDTRTFRLNLPKLKEFRLLFNGTQVSLDFMLPMKDSLERICVMSFRGLNVECDNVLTTFGIQKIWTTSLCEFFELLHFNKSFEEIQEWVKTKMPTYEKDRVIIGNKLLLI